MKILLMIGMLSVSTNETVLLEATYTQVKDTDPEYAQVAIEKCDVRHARVGNLVFVIEVPTPADPGDWQRRLNAAVDVKHGRFTVRRATAEEEEAVRSGRLTLQQ
jgi:hypothetical protein